MKKIICILLLSLLLCGTLTSCINFDEFGFKIYSCGSGFYINKSPNKTYTIKELGVESVENYFYLEDYFVSEELGQEYKIKKGIFNVGSVFLAKKEDHYNPELYSFELNRYSENNEIIYITSDMSYVEIFSTDPTVSHRLYIQIEPRQIPVDITFKNVYIDSKETTPIIFSKSTSDINIIVEGVNIFSAGSSKITLNEHIEAIKNDCLAPAENAYRSAVQFVKEEYEFWKSTGNGDQSFADVGIHYFDHITNLEIAMIDSALSVFTGTPGECGLDGATAILVPGGISFSGTGELKILGGNGANGKDASLSIFGLAYGGKGGDGGAGIICSNLLITESPSLTIKGGIGGKGGEGSKGFLGRPSEKNGSRGKDGLDTSVSNPRKSAE